MDSEKVKQIKKALKCCSEGKCEKCSIGKKDIRKCIDTLFKDTLTLINELEKEASTIINELEIENKRLKQSNKNVLFVNECVIEQNQQLKDQIAELKMENANRTDTIAGLLKHFVEKLKEKVHKRDYVQGYAEIGLCEEIDETLKEFISGKV